MKETSKSLLLGTATLYNDVHGHKVNLEKHPVCSEKKNCYIAGC